MNKFFKKMFAFTMALMLCASGMVFAKDVNAAPKKAKTLNGTYTTVVESFDWGPGVTRLIVKLDKVVKGNKKGNFKAEDFSVVTTKQGYAADYSPIEVEEERNITAVYTCTKSGRKIKGASRYIAIDMEVSPSAGSPFYYSLATSLNNWSDPYTNEITLVNPIKSGIMTYNTLNVKPEMAARKLVQGSKFKTGSYEELNYAYYKPVTKKKNGLVVWLHGTGEGGTAP